MQAISVPRMTDTDLWTAVEDIDPLAVVTERLLGLAEPAPLPGVPTALTADRLRALRTATLATLAADLLLEPGLVTGCVLGSGFALQAQVTVATRYLTDLSHLALCPTTARAPLSVGSRLADRLDLAGIDWSVTEEIAEAVLGANLVLVTETGPLLAQIRRLSAGALLVNASGAALPAALTRRVGAAYVDDLDALPANGLRRADAFGHGRAVAAELRELVLGPRPVRFGGENVLVELIGGGVLDAALAHALYSAVLRRRLRTRTEW